MTNETPKYFIDDGIPGVGNRPDWLDSKFNTIADLAKSYKELEKKFTTAPEEYDISRSKFLDKEDESIKGLLKTARDNRVPKAVIDNMVDSLDKYMSQFDVNPEDEIKKLGDNATERMKVLDNWAKANLSDDSYKALQSNINTASGIKAMEEIRSKLMSNNTVIPSGNDASANNVETVESLQKEIALNLEKYKTDDKFRKGIQDRLTVATKAAGMLDKHGN